VYNEVVANGGEGAGQADGAATDDDEVDRSIG
jgi:hypothetical protein